MTAALLLAVLTTAPAERAETHHYRPVAVETRLKDLEPERAERLQPLLEKHATEALQLRDVETDQDSSTTVVFHVISVAQELDPNAAISDYGTHIEVHIDGEKVGEEITLCTRKSEAELIDCALSGLPKVMELLPQEASQSQEDSPTGPEHEEEKKVPLAPLGRLGVAGIAIGAVGIGTAIAGGYFLARGEVDETANPAGTNRSDYSRPGIGLLAAGGALVATGVVLTVVGVLRTKKQKRKQSTRVLIDTSPNFAGLHVSGRF